MILTSQLIAGFTKSLLAHKFDNPKPTPAFHVEMWDYCCSENSYIAIAAPRGHAKSTAISLCYTLACIMFRINDYVWIISDTETQSIQFVQDIKTELLENDELRQLFNIRKIIKDNEKDLIFSMGPDSHKVRITAKSTGGSVRGGKWNNKRPNLIIGDDLENDEIVMNLDRRQKFREWFFGAVMPALSDYGKIRLVGTILHFDSFLNRLMPPLTGPGSEFTVIEPLKTYSTDTSRSWKAILYRSHPSINDFSQFLWEDKFNEERLKAIRETYMAQGYPEGYSQEYLNNPIDDTKTIFKKDDFVEMTPEDRLSYKDYYLSSDFAVSTAERADYTVLMVAGMDEKGIMHVVDVRRGRWDTKESIDELFNLYQAWNCISFLVEKGVIERAMGPFINDEMNRNGRPYLNIEKFTVSSDKRSRSRPIQGRMRSRGCKFDKQASWYMEFEEELLRFDRGVYDDQVDALALLGIFVNNMFNAPTKKELMQLEWEEDMMKDKSLMTIGRNSTTGY